MNRRWLSCSLLLLILPLFSAPRAVGQNPVPATTLTTSSKTLLLPGSLKLTATVAPPATTGGMPTGTVTFLNGTTSLGTGALSMVPSSENLSATPIVEGPPAATTGIGYSPFGLFTVNLPKSVHSNLGVLDWYYASYSESFYPEITMFSGEGTNLFQTSAPYQITNSNIIGVYPGIDAFAVADFNNDGVADVVLHGFNGNTNEYYMLPGTANGGWNQAADVISTDNSGIQCSCSNPTELMTVDDFNGDGYPDIAYAANQNFYNGNVVGVVLNGGAGAPGSFTKFNAATEVPSLDGQAFLPAGITSGHFTASGHADLVIAGSYDNLESGLQTPGLVALYLGKGDGTFAAPVTVTAGDNPGPIATGSFRNNGMTDVVVSNQGISSDATTIEVFFGDGKGDLAVSSTVTVGVSMTSVKVADFNNDGYPDILAAGVDGSLNVLLNDGTGHFSTVTQITNEFANSSSSAPSFTALGDFNGDGLADIAQLTQYSQSDSSTLSTAVVVLNAASSQATLTTAAQTLPAGTDTLTASYPGDNNFAASTSRGVDIAVTQTAPTLTWPPPAAMEYGVPLSGTQLDATANVGGAITYSPSAGTVLAPGGNTVTATFVPTDAFDYAGATAQQTVTVTAPSLTGVTPSSFELGTANATITVAGQGLVNGAVVEANGTALTTTWVSLNQVTAVLTTTLAETPGPLTIAVVDPKGVAVAGTGTVTVTAASLTAASPGNIELGTANATITVTGQGLANGAVVKANGTALATTWVSLSEVTAVLTTALAETPGPLTITVVDPNGVAVAGTGTVTITAPTLTGVTPGSIELGTPNAMITVAGQGLANGAVVKANGTALTTTWVSLNQLTAVLPAALADTPGSLTITVVDPNGVAVGGTGTFTVNPPSLTGITPSSALIGAANTSITVAGQGFENGAVVEANGTALATTWVSLNQVTATLPASMLTSAGTITIAVVDPNKLTVPGTATFTVIASPAVAKASAPTTTAAGQSASITLTVSPYPTAITATLTLSFTPTPPITVSDPTVLFSNNTTTDVIQIPANSTAAIPAIDFSPGSTAGTITVTVVLTSGGANITPATLVPLTTTVQALPPVIQSVTLTRTGNSMSVAILGLSTTRDMTQATFHFTPAQGKSLKTTELTVDVGTPFTNWYGSAGSDQYGTTFLYTQIFNLSDDATTVGSVSVTLTNSQGESQPGTAQ